MRQNTEYLERYAVGIWSKFKGSEAWHSLKRFTFLRSGYHLGIELVRVWGEEKGSAIDYFETHFRSGTDPWNYETSTMEQERFAKQTELLDDARDGKRFTFGLEIGCAEGLYTQVIAERCNTLQVLDLSPTALDRARGRRQWPSSVRFDRFDVRRDAIPGTFDLIVIAGVLEYFSNPTTFHRIRTNLCSALRPGGIMLIETTRVTPVVENAWWARYLIKGRWINDFMSRTPELIEISSASTEEYVITLLRKQGKG